MSLCENLRESHVSDDWMFAASWLVGFRNKWFSNKKCFHLMDSRSHSEHKNCKAPKTGGWDDSNQEIASLRSWVRTDRLDAQCNWISISIIFRLSWVVTALSHGGAVHHM